MSIALASTLYPVLELIPLHVTIVPLSLRLNFLNRRNLPLGCQRFDVGMRLFFSHSYTSALAIEQLKLADSPGNFLCDAGPSMTDTAETWWH